MAHFPLDLWSLPKQEAAEHDSDSDSDVEGIVAPTIPLPHAGGGSARLSADISASACCRSSKPSARCIEVQRDPNDIRSMKFAQCSVEQLLRDFKCTRLQPGGKQLLLELHSCLVHTVARVEQQARAAGSRPK